MDAGIPSIDLNDFLSGDTQRKEKFVQELGRAYEEIGFVAVKGHLLTNDTSSNLYQQVQNFFYLPLDKKVTFEDPEIAGQRGYVGFGKEHAKGRSEGDLKEFWHFGQTVEGDDPIRSEYPDNIFVPELPAFNEFGIKAYKQLEETGKHMLRAIALYLGLDEFYFDAKIKNGNSILRPIHYPPITNEPKSALPEQLVVNVGDMLQRLTNNKLKSTTHRVVNPPREKWGTSRFSIPFFLHPRSEMRLDCLESCVTSSYQLHYEPISAGEYLNERLREIGLKK
jgi:isopenicillin N synthase-like dioxygenase